MTCPCCHTEAIRDGTRHCPFCGTDLAPDHAVVVAGTPPRVAATMAEFTGRAWLLPQALHWLEQTDERMLLVTGLPGSGKSMVAAWLMGAGPLPTDPSAAAQLERIRAQVRAAHFCVWSAAGSTAPRELARNVAQQLTRTVPGFGESLSATLAGQVRITSEQHMCQRQAQINT